MMSSFNVDALLANLKKLQNEKNCLEQKLKKCREKRRQSETELERVAGKNMQVDDVHRKMVENLKVAQLKVTQTQSQTDSLEDANQKKREKISALNKRIENEKNNQQNFVDQFEGQLEELTEKLIHARNYYKEDNLQKDLRTLKDKLETMAKILTERKQEEELLVLTLDQPQVQEPTEPVLSPDVCQCVWSMVEDENKAIHNYLDQLQSDLKGIHESPAQSTSL